MTTEMVGLVIVPISLFFAGMIASYTSAIQRGRHQEEARHNKESLLAIHRRIDDLRASVEILVREIHYLREVLVRAQLIVPNGSQVGDDGRGVSNPLKDATTLTD